MSTVRIPAERIEAARALWDQGLSSYEIGRRLGVTKNAVVGMAHRNGFAPRENPMGKRGPNWRPRGPRKTPRITLPSISPASPWPCAAAWAEPAGDAQADVSSPVETSPTVAMPSAAFSGRWNNPSGERRAIPSLRPFAPTTPTRRCQFPTWGDERPTHRFCNAPAVIGSYCREHHAATHVLASPRPVFIPL